MTTTHAAMNIRTADDLWRLPEDGQRHELVRGEITRMAPAGGEHGGLAHKVALLLGNHVLAKRLGKVLAAETGFFIERDPDTVRAPDAAFISKARIPAAGLPKRFIPFAPDIAVEVVSPGDSLEDVQEKIEQWLAAGTVLVWVVNPRNKSVTVHRTGRDPRILRRDDTLGGEEACPGFCVKVSEIFAD